MQIRLSLFRDCKYLDPKATCEVAAPLRTRGVDLREEYVNAFSTESYNEFCARATGFALSHGGGATALRPQSDVRHLVERLLEPDQPATDEILAHAKKHCRPETHVLLSDYYDETSKASLLCGLLLSDVERVRTRYLPLRVTLHSLAPSSGGAVVNEAKAPPQAVEVEHYLAGLSTLSNPFGSLSTSQDEFRAVQAGSANLLRRLESGRKKAKSRLRRLGRLKRAATAFLVVLTVSTSAVGLYVAVHILLALAALPALGSTRMASTRWLARVLAQLDAATKGIYILSRDLDTIGRLVTRLHDEVEHMLALLRLCSERCERKWGLMREVVRQMWKADATFSQQLDELEQHLYLCFMTINKVRCLVMREVLPVPKIK